MSLNRFTHSAQIASPSGPAISRTWLFDLPQKEHAMSVSSTHASLPPMAQGGCLPLAPTDSFRHIQACGDVRQNCLNRR
jgi:hypothetical protein